MRRVAGATIPMVLWVARRLDEFAWWLTWITASRAYRRVVEADEWE